jgi:F-type H+-transporting ATPase subunit gamma
METIADVRRRLESAQDLGAIVSTMRALALASIRQYERAVESLADYNRATELGLHVILTQAFRDNRPLPLESRRPLSERTTGIIVFGSDQGMCGQFNEQIASFALEQLAEMAIPAEKRQILAVGARVTGHLLDAGESVAAVYDVPGSVIGITPVVQELLLRSGQWRVPRSGQPPVEQVFLFYNKLISAAAYRPIQRQLLPINRRRLQTLVTESSPDFVNGDQASPASDAATSAASGDLKSEFEWPSRSLPTFTMEWSALFSALLRQYLFVSLFRAFAESLASENAARLVAMQAAERNIEERIDEFQALYHHLRQNAITSELLDIISGFEMLTKP